MRVRKIFKGCSLMILLAAFVVAGRMSFNGAWKSGPETMGMSELEKGIYLVRLNMPYSLTTFLVLAVIAFAVWRLAEIKSRAQALHHN